MLSSLRRQIRPRFARAVSQAVADPTTWNQAPVVITTLPNGVRVATRQTFGETATVGLFVDSGVRNETVETQGATRVLEQLAGYGSKKRAKAAFETEVEGLGASLGLSFGREQTAYTLTVAKGDVKQGVNIVTDIALKPPTSSLAKEKAAILETVQSSEKPTRAVLDDRLHICAFRDGPLGFSSIGPFEGAEGLTEAHLNSHIEKNYSAEKLVLAAAGPVSHEELVKLATAELGSVKPGTPALGLEKPYFCGAELLYRNDEMGPTAYICAGWEAVPWRSPDAVTFMVMQHIIGSYKKSTGLVPGTISGNRVINAVANKMQVGCADEFEAFTRFYKDTGVFGYYIACDEVAVEHAIGELMFGINLLSFSVTDEEVERGKRELKVALFGSDGSTASIVTEVGMQVLAYGRGVPPAELVLRIDAIDAEEVKRVAWKYLNDNEIAVTALGPLHGMPQYYDLRRATCMHRY